jgi:hypothetical protein
MSGVRPIFKRAKIVHICRHVKTIGYGFTPIGVGGYEYCNTCERYCLIEKDQVKRAVK